MFDATLRLLQFVNFHLKFKIIFCALNFLYMRFVLSFLVLADTRYNSYRKHHKNFHEQFSWKFSFRFLSFLCKKEHTDELRRFGMFGIAFRYAGRAIKSTSDIALRRRRASWIAYIGRQERSSSSSWKSWSCERNPKRYSQLPVCLVTRLTLENRWHIFIPLKTCQMKRLYCIYFVFISWILGFNLRSLSVLNYTYVKIRITIKN